MGNETTALKSPASGRRATANGRQVVGDFTGQRAGDAAQAVRRAGLRPGLQRSFGCDPSLLGLVVSQEPAAGSALARNGMVTLHVAAPGNDGATGQSTPAAPVQRTPVATPPASGPPVSVSVEGDREPRDAASVSRRRRKPGLAGRARPSFELPPAPLAPAAASAPVWEEREAWDVPVEPDPAVEVDSAERSEETSEADVFDGLTAEEFVVRVDDVFAGRTGRWRRARRTRRARETGGRIRGRLAAHPWLSACVAFAVGLWVLLGTLGAFAGRRPAPVHPARSRLVAHGPIAHTARTGRTPAGSAGPRRREVARLAIARQTVPARPRTHPPARRASTVRPVVRTPAPAASAPAQPAPGPASAGVPVRASEPAPSSPPVAEQRSGGLFSP